MGGRGGESGFSSSEKIAGLSVTIKGESTKYFFSSKNGQNFYKRGVEGTPEPTPQNMSAKEFERRIVSNGAKVEKISKSEINRLEKEYREGRKKTEKFLDEQWYKAAPRPRKGMKGH